MTFTSEDPGVKIQLIVERVKSEPEVPVRVITEAELEASNLGVQVPEQLISVITILAAVIL